MPTNTFAPNGFVYSRQRAGGSATMQPSIRQIKNGYASAIGIGDIVKTLTAPSQGFIGLGTSVDVALLGIYATMAGSGVIGGAVGSGYYDANMQQYAYGLNGSYVATAAPVAGTNIAANIIDDPFALFRVQLLGAAWSEAYRGRNINFAANGAPNASGISTAYVDGATISNDPVLPWKIYGPVGMVGGAQDPNNANPWVEVYMNTPEALASIGI